jgi:TolB-like protein
VPPLAPGQRVGRFLLERELGRGALGVVFQARDVELGRSVAFELLQPGMVGDGQPWRAAEPQASLVHRNLVHTFDVGSCPQGPWLVRELLQGQSLAGRLRRGALPPPEAVALALEVARALAYAHARGVLHLGLAPSNVFLAAGGAVKLLDLGLAHALGRRRAELGELEYAAPEQLGEAPADARADVHALGALLRAMLTGAPPGDPHGPAAGNEVGATRPEGPPPELEPLLDQLTAAAPEARPADGGAALAALQALASARGWGAAPASAEASLRLRPSRRRWPLAAALLLLLGGAAAFALARRAGPAARPSVAVLPFADLSAGRDQEYFAEGLSEEILEALAQVPGLHVAARPSAFSFKGQNEDLREVGRKLGVDAVLEGSIRKEGSHVRVTAQLIKAADGFHLWSQNFDRDLAAVFAVQDEIAAAVVSSLRVELLAGRAPASRAGRTSDPRAHDLYLQGRRLARDDTVEGGRLAAATFERAIAIDPGYAPAWAGLSNAIYWGWADEADQAQSDEALRASQARALAAAERAVALDPQGSLGHVARGFLRASIQHDWPGARADLETALAASPGIAHYHLYYARYVVGPLGQLPLAVAEAARATELDPLNAKAWGVRCELLVAAGQVEPARLAALRSLELAPQQVIAPGCLAAAALVGGQPAEALAAAGRIAEPLFRLQLEAVALQDLGRRREAQARLDALVQGHGPDAPFQIAGVHAWRGEADEAFLWLARAEAGYDPGLPDLKLEPLLRPLRRDPRWAQLLGRLALPVDDAPAR